MEEFVEWYIAYHERIGKKISLVNVDQAKDEVGKTYSWKRFEEKLHFEVYHEELKKTVEHHFAEKSDNRYIVVNVIDEDENEDEFYYHVYLLSEKGANDDGFTKQELEKIKDLLAYAKNQIENVKKETRFALLFKEKIDTYSSSWIKKLAEARH